VVAELDFTCTCGAVTGKLIEPGPTVGDHLMCHCTDCQNFARYLGAADRVLQAHGGTELYQGRCATMRLTKGAEKLACLHLTDKPTLRWYTTCCRTPMFNTFAHGRVPYITTFMANCDPAQAKAALGPIIGHLSLPESVEGLPRMSFGKLMRRFFGRMVKDVLTGDRKRTALFDPKTFAPISAPYRLTDDERRALGLRRDHDSPGAGKLR
jgi:hypothetical protein